MNWKQVKWQEAGGSLLFACNIFVLVLLLAGNRVAVPSWLQVMGRMHPLVLHFPIVLLMIGAGLLFIRLREPEAAHWKKQFTAALLLAGALTTGMAVIMGLLLSREEGYTADGALFLHKWGGALLLWVASACYWLRNARHQWYAKSSGLAAVALIIFTGHYGAAVTHGENFVLAPVTPEKKAVPVQLEQALVYEHLVRPILEEKCMSCHNPAKAKGSLSLEDTTHLLAGGKTGKLFIPGDPAASLLMLRLHLPEEDKKHMPPSNKPQLTEDEVALLHHWIKSGGDFNTMVTALPPQDTLRMLASARLQPAAGDNLPTFAPADEKLVAKLNNNYRVLYPVALHAAPLIANWYNKDQFSIASVKELLPVKGQLIEMHLQKMPVADADLAILAEFKELRVLNLSFTQVTGKTLAELAKLPQLQSLSVAGAPVTLAQLMTLKNAPKLRKLYVWNTALTQEEMVQAEKAFPLVTIVKGFDSNSGEQLQLNQPVLVNTDAVFRDQMQLQLKHPVKGVEIRYTTDGTAPDSISSPLFKDSLLLDKTTTIRAIACKKGWNNSAQVQYVFSQSRYKPDSVTLVQPPDGQYVGEGAKTLTDARKGTGNYGDGKWLGYANKPLEAVAYFPKPVSLHEVTISAYRHIEAYIFPPEKIEIWGGSSPQQLRLLKKIVPAQGQKGDSVMPVNYLLNFPATEVSYLKVVLAPVSRLPQWHQGKGGRGWVFVDELMFN